MSHPLWEILDFQVPNLQFLDDPAWFEVSKATALLQQLEDSCVLPRTHAPQRRAESLVRRLKELRPNSRLWNMARRARSAGQLGQQAVAITWKHIYGGQNPSLHNQIVSSEIYDVDIFYGPGLLFEWSETPARVRAGLEHGTLRWIRSGAYEDRLLRKTYLDRLKALDHLWVTNLDPETLDVAEEFMEGKWSALPHPYMFNLETPYPEMKSTREGLCQVTDSCFLIFMPSSINWGDDHDKGTRVALTAFIELRSQGLPVGLILTRWGRDLAEAEDILAAANCDRFATWIEPQPRIPFQRLMANVDVVWDQFKYEAMGGIAFKAMEQGTPVITRGVSSRGADLMGCAPPFTTASDTNSLTLKTREFFDMTNQLGRRQVRERFGTPLRDWLLTHHTPQLTAHMQVARYRELLQGSSSTSRAVPQAWADLMSSNQDSSLSLHDTGDGTVQGGELTGPQSAPVMGLDN